MKALLKILVLIGIIFAVSTTAFAQEPLRFDENGEFKLLIVADTQDLATPQEETLKLLNSALDETKPDLVVFLGDQVAGPFVKGEEKTRATIDTVVAPVVNRGLKFAVVFGNHDDDVSVSKERQMEIYRSYPGCLAIEGEDISGCGNYVLPILSKNSEKAVANLWFFDSNSYPEDGVGKYDRVHEDQLSWYLKETNKRQKANNGESIPGFAFQHIIVPEIYDALIEVPSEEKDEEGVVEGYGIREGHYYKLPDSALGTLGEGPCPPDVNGGEFSAWQEGGDIIAAFFGHDHVNDFLVEHEGIQLINTTGTGFYNYGAGDKHGVRTVVIKEEDVENFTTQMHYYEELTGEAVSLSEFEATTGIVVIRLIVKGVTGIILVLALITFIIIKLIKRKSKAKTK